MKNTLILLTMVALCLCGCVPPGGVGQVAAPPPDQAAGNVSQAVPGPESFPEKRPASVPKSRYEILAEKPPKLVPGAKYLYKRTNCVTGDFQISVSRIKSTVNWMGVPAYIVELGKPDGMNYVITGYLVLNTNLNTLAILDKGGKLLQAVKDTPSAPVQQGGQANDTCIKIYNWPLMLGKSFSVEYEVFNNNDKKSFRRTDQVSVDNHLMLTKTPLGEWTTFKIDRISSGAIETHYYSPELGIEVKQDISQTLDNAEGPGVFMVELIGYTIPGAGQAGQQMP